ncbi:MAG: hypothetical protein LBM41_00800 [Ruminococcus sp.]|jgi:hypothetical protein|nr:hypothetical protein [Ruminococcus sp.]
MKKIISAFVITIIACFAVPLTASAVMYEESLILDDSGKLTYIGTEVDVNVLGGGSYEFNPIASKLTLTDVHFITDAMYALDLTYYESPLTLEIVGSNSFESAYEDMGESAGIYTEANLTITGGGSLTAIGGTSTYSNSYGLFTYGDVIISDVSVTATGGTAKYWSDGISSYNIEITDSNVTATGGAGSNSNGINAALDMEISDSIITAIGSEATTTSCGINAVRKLDISGGAVTATGESYGIGADHNLAISGGTVTATGGIGISAANRFDISGGNITATGDGCGVETLYIYISDGNITATGGGEAYKSYGIFVHVNFESSGGSVTATGGKATNESHGIYTGNLLEISGGTVKATGGEADSDSYGIFAYGAVDIFGGVLTLRGETSAANMGTVKPTVAFVSDSLIRERLINDEIELNAIKYFEGYATLADYKKAYPDTLDLDLDIEDTTVYNSPAPPSPPAVTVPLTDFDDGENVGSITLSKKVKTVIRFNSKRLSQTEEYVYEKWGTEVLGSFETAQKGGWGNIASITISLEELGFEVSDKTLLKVLIFDTKTKKWHEAETIIENGKIVIETEYSGIFAVITE